jgi:hypothetical protein
MSNFCRHLEIGKIVRHCHLGRIFDPPMTCFWPRFLTLGGQVGRRGRKGRRGYRGGRFWIFLDFLEKFGFIGK